MIVDTGKEPVGETMQHAWHARRASIGLRDLSSDGCGVRGDDTLVGGAPKPVDPRWFRAKRAGRPPGGSRSPSGGLISTKET